MTQVVGTRPTVLRNRGNFYSGWFVAVGVLALNIAIDSMHLYSRWGDAPNETPLQALPLYLCWLALGLGAFAVFSRPRVEVGPDTVVLRNVFRDVVIPTEAIEKLDDSGKYLVVTAAGHRYSAAATEASNLTMMLGRQGTARALESALQPRPEGRSAETRPVRVTVRGAPRGAELAMLVAYLLYPTAALLKQFAL